MHIWLQQLQEKLINTFDENLYFIGLQGSHARYEAQSTSDINVVVLFRDFSFETLQAYEAVVSTMPNRFLLCGFVGGIEDLYTWNPSDLFTFVHDTMSLYGSITQLMPRIQKTDVASFVKTTASYVYHEASHNYVHQKSHHTVEQLLKRARFAIQGQLFLQHGVYIHTLSDLLLHATGTNKAIIERFSHLKSGSSIQFHHDTEILLLWAKQALREAQCS